jgi:hypothetical protein
MKEKLQDFANRFMGANFETSATKRDKKIKEIQEKEKEIKSIQEVIDNTEFFMNSDDRMPGDFKNIEELGKQILILNEKLAKLRAELENMGKVERN